MVISPTLCDLDAPSDSSSIRMAGLADIPAIERITQEGPPAGIEPEVMSRATRLLLTLVAFEHGALWVEQAHDGSILRAVTAVPAGQLPPQRSLMRDVAQQLGVAAIPLPAAAKLGQAFLAELRAVEPAWVLIEISKRSSHRSGEPALLGVALEWARAQSDPERDPVMVLADSMPERAAAESLGFVERRTWGYGWPWWLGVAAPVAHTDG
jgi:hypothetical protein